VSREGGVVERWRGAAIYGKTMSRPTTSGAAMVTGAAGGGGRVSGDLTRTKDRPDWLPGRLLLDRSSGGGRRRQGGPTSAKAMALRFERHGRTASPRAHPDRRRLPTPPLGAQITFEPLWVALDALPHLLVEGTTGSGKSVFLRSLLWQFTHLYMPSDLDLVVIDAKGMSDYLDFSRAPHIKSGDDFHLGVDGALDLLGEIVETRLPARTRAFSSYARKALDREAPRHLTNLREVLADAARYGEEAPVRPGGRCDRRVRRTRAREYRPPPVRDFGHALQPDSSRGRRSSHRCHPASVRRRSDGPDEEQLRPTGAPHPRKGRFPRHPRRERR
jgi:FtsK/SpoIIIE family